MAKHRKNHGTPWTTEDRRQLRTLVAENTPTRVIALKLERTLAAIYTFAAEAGVSLKPTNQSPYNRRRRS